MTLTPRDCHGRFLSTLILISLSVGLLGCSRGVESPSPPVASTPPASAAIAQRMPTAGQSLPITAQTVINGTTIQIEVANTPQQQATGLMFRSALAADRGMLFPFEPPRPVQFWMKNVSISLDMVFLREGQVVAIAADVPPCTTTPCPVYGPPDVIDQVLELPGGRAAELGLAVGDRLVIEAISTP